MPARAVFIDDAIEFGKVTADREVFTYESEEDQTVTLTAIPDEGYQLRELFINTAEGRVITSDRPSMNTYTFVMPMDDVYVGGEFALYQKGDVNLDGKIDISDIVAIINTMAGNPQFKYSADVNGDESIDISDVVAVINIMAGAAE